MSSPLMYRTAPWPTLAPVTVLPNPGRTSPHPIGFLHSSPRENSVGEDSPKHAEADSGYCSPEGEDGGALVHATE